MATADDEYLAIQRLSHRLRLVDELEAHASEGFHNVAMPQSLLGNDDAVLSPFDLSHIVGHALAVSLDQLRSTRLILRDDNNPAVLRLPMVGLYSLLRSAVEAGSLAVWLLASDEPKERRRRALQARWDDVLRDDDLAVAFTADIDGDSRDQRSKNQKIRRENSKSVREKKNRIRAIGKACEVDEAEFIRGLPGFGPITGLAAEELGIRGPSGRSMWHVLSGLSHPSVSRALSFSDLEETDSPQSASTIRGRFTAKPVLVNAALESGILLHWAALERAFYLGGNEKLKFTLPPDFPIPPGFTMPRSDQRENFH